MPNTITTVKTPTGNNATLTVATKSKVDGFELTSYRIGITSLNTMTSMQIVESQTRSSIARMPIRRSEQIVQFTISWPIQVSSKTRTPNQDYDFNGFKLMQRFHNDLRAHQKIASTSKDSPPPMWLVYNNNSYEYRESPEYNNIVEHNLRGLTESSKPGWNKVPKLSPLAYSGWIQIIPKTYDRFNPVYDQQYIMNVLSPSNGTSAYITPGQYDSFITSPGVATQQGINWTSANIGRGVNINIQGIPG